MDTAYKKTLELDKILARAVQLCACRETKEMMQDLQPCETPDDERYSCFHERRAGYVCPHVCA